MSTTSMPQIDRRCVKTMKSPIRFLMSKNVGNSVFNIAPERKAEFATTLNNFELVYTNERPWVFCADPKARKIFVSRGAIELIWCASLAHVLFYELRIQGKRFDRHIEIDPHSDPRLDKALKLLLWALQCQRDGNSSDDWPRGLPRPLEMPAPEADENVADELCLVSCAFLLHHELAHLRLEHVERVDDESSVQREKDADIAAAEWVLDGVKKKDPKFVKRILGIAQANLITTALGLYKIKSLGGKTHPFSHDRLVSLLNRFLGNSNHDVKAFAFAVLALHFQNSGRQMKKGKFNDFAEALEALCDQIADEIHADKNVTR